MNYKTIFFLAFLHQMVFSETLILKLKNKCDLDSNEINIKCYIEKEDIKIERKNNIWVRYWAKDKTINLTVVLDDENMLILSQPVMFSGTRMFYLNKLNKKIIYSEIAYSEIIKQNGLTTSMGEYSISL